LKPAPFRYARPENLADAVGRVAAGGPVVQVLAGGQGLVPMLNLRLAHDCGRELDPLIVEGMVRGSTVHGIGAAVLEEFRYDEAGQLLTSTFLDYLKPTATDVRAIEVERLEHPSPFTPLGAKGVGEGGAIPGPATVANAVEDALAPFGTTIRSLPVTPERVWQWMRAGRAELST